MAGRLTLRDASNSRQVRLFDAPQGEVDTGNGMSAKAALAFTLAESGG
jgi:hypothetical protein